MYTFYVHSHQVSIATIEWVDKIVIASPKTSQRIETLTSPKAKRKKTKTVTLCAHCGYKASLFHGLGMP